MISVTCEICNKTQMVIPSRAKNYKTCSYECSSIRIKNKTVLNSTCTNCKKEFHIKESQVKRYNRNMGIFCSTKMCNHL